MWRRNRAVPDPEDPAAVAVEKILDRVAPAVLASDLLGRERSAAAHALFICACVAVDWSLNWLIYETAEGQLVWSRIPDEAEPSSYVDAVRILGGHADPAVVLRWLLGEARTRGRVPATVTAIRTYSLPYAGESSAGA